MRLTLLVLCFLGLVHCSPSRSVTPLGEPVVNDGAGELAERAAAEVEAIVAANVKPTAEGIEGNVPAVSVAARSSRFVVAGAVASETVATQQAFDGPEWAVDRDDSLGLLVAARPSGIAKPTSTRLVLSAAARELDALGIAAGERGELLYRTLMGQDQERGSEVKMQAKLVSHKVFVFRSIGGIRVESHRTVLTFEDDKHLSRVYARWPALATSGHKLRSKLTSQQLIERSKTSLAAEGLVGRAAKIGFQYVPTTQKDGRVTLELTGVAEASAEDGERQFVRVPVDAY